MTTLYVTRRGEVCPALLPAWLASRAARKPSLAPLPEAMKKPIRPAPEVLARIMQHPVPKGATT